MKTINPLYGALGGDFVGSIYERLRFLVYSATT